MWVASFNSINGEHATVILYKAKKKNNDKKLEATKKRRIKSHQRLLSELGK